MDFLTGNFNKISETVYEANGMFHLWPNIKHCLLCINGMKVGIVLLYQNSTVSMERFMGYMGMFTYGLT
jgi:hypothetical protein